MAEGSAALFAVFRGKKVDSVSVPVHALQSSPLAMSVRHIRGKRAVAKWD